MRFPCNQLIKLSSSSYNWHLRGRNGAVVAIAEAHVRVFVVTKYNPGIWRCEMWRDICNEKFMVCCIKALSRDNAVTENGAWLLARKKCTRVPTRTGLIQTLERTNIAAQWYEVIHISSQYFFFWREYCQVHYVTMCRIQGSSPGRVKRVFFPLLRNAQTGSGAHPANCFFSE